jgi:hypothetical protein
MTSRAIFEIAVRIIGLLVIIVSLLYLVYAVILFCNPYYPEPAIHYVFIGGPGLLLGWFLLRGAPVVVRFAYGRKSDSDGTPQV